MRYDVVERLMLLVGTTAFWCGVVITLYLFFAGILSATPPADRAAWHRKGLPPAEVSDTDTAKEQP
jgi:hypothetical protein